jgi:hypothetical protein
MEDSADPSWRIPPIFDGIRWLEWYRQRKRVAYSCPPAYWTIPMDLSSQVCGLSVHDGEPIMLVRQSVKLDWLPMVPWEFVSIGPRHNRLLEAMDAAHARPAANGGRTDAHRNCSPMHGDGLSFVCRDHQINGWSTPRFGLYIEACGSILNLIRGHTTLWLGLYHDDGSVSVDSRVTLR